MEIPGSVRRWSRLPSRVALILGVGGAVATAEARADIPQIRPDVNAAATGLRELAIRIEAERIFLSEAGGEFRELPLGDTPEARRLRQLLEANDAAKGPGGVRLSPLLLAGGGGSGFHWNPFAKAQSSGNAGKTAGENAPGKSSRPETTDPAHKANETVTKKKQ
jgi:hypothetical protein